MLKYAIIPLAGLIAGAGLLITTWNAAGQQFEHTARVAMVARDGVQTGPPFNIPPPGAGYCAPAPSSGVPSPPNAVFGLLTIGGAPAPVGTIVTLTFSGLPGPSAAVTDAGGYRVLWAAGGAGQTPPCINEVGTELGLLVNGVLVNTGKPVGPESAPVLRFDVAVP